MITDNYSTFKDLVYNAKTIKSYYIRLLSSFSIYEIRERNEITYNLKRNLYSKDIEFWKIDKIWEYLNNDITYYELFMLRNI